MKYDAYDVYMAALKRGDGSHRNWRIWTDMVNESTRNAIEMRRGQQMTTISMDKTYTTRDGRPVRLLCVDGPDENMPIVGFLEPIVGFLDVHIYTWPTTGKYAGHAYESPVDLIEAKRTGWINIYNVSAPNSLGLMSRDACLYDTKEHADYGVTATRTACIQIEWEE